MTIQERFICFHIGGAVDAAGARGAQLVRECSVLLERLPAHAHNHAATAHTDTESEDNTYQDGDDDREHEVEENKPEIQINQAELVLNRQLHSPSNPLLLDSKAKKPQLTVKPYNNPRGPLSKILIRRPFLVSSEGSEPGNMKQAEPIIKENWLVQNEQTQSVIEINGESCSEQNCEQPLSPPTADDNEPDEDVQPELVTEERPSQTKNPMDTPGLPSQPHLVHKRPSPLVCHYNSISKSFVHEIPIGKSKEANGIQHPQLHQLLITSSTLLRPPSRANLPQQYEHAQTPFVPVSSTPSLKPPLKTYGRNSTEVTYSHQKSHVQGVPSSTYHTQAQLDLSSQRYKHTTKRKSVSIAKKLVEKIARFEGITKNIPVMQQPPNPIMQLNLPSDVVTLRAAPPTQKLLQQAFPLGYPKSNVGENVDQRLPPHGMVVTSASQNLSHLARQRNIQPSIDQRTYLQSAVMNPGHVLLNQANKIHQPTQFLPPREHQRLQLSVDYIQELMRNEMLKGSVDGTHVSALVAQNGGANIQHVAQNPSFIPSQPQSRQNTPNYRDPRITNIQIALPVASNSNGEIPKPQEVTTEERAPAVTETSNQPLPNVLRQYSHHNPRKLAKLSQSPIVHHEICAATVPENIEVQTESTIHNSEAQTTMPFNQLQQKIDVDGKPAKAMDSECQSDDYFMEEQESLHQEKAPDSDVVSHRDIVSNYEDPDDQKSSDGSLIDTEETHVSEKYASPAAIAERPAVAPSPTQEKQQELSRMERQETLDKYQAVLSEMYGNLMRLRDGYNSLLNSTLVIAQLYDKELGPEEDKPTEFVKISASEAPPVAKKTPVEIPEPGSSSNGGRKKNSRISTAPSKNHKRRYTFVLPPEYDPNDSRWTLKHRKNGPGLIELIPQSRIYVNEKRFKKVIESSNDCRALARLLLTEVFSKNALSVCSMTGGQARAFKPLENDVRPGLDKHARLVLLAFIEEYGNKRKWNTADTMGIISSIRTKIQEMRAKFGKKKLV
ncbi:uncharacterized protein LOC133532689 [Cydia pomonella]|uniref:uncharacterized protein LOC133532689 n=1 Tax=Cydia pomonella TaxID=82600 RepID=UPI002ADD7F47|nr:uncharacterized protein LOC133532689 [Cydia pomonella]